ncbi:hypothetical protein [Bacillus inaquosorum]|uniref:Uncharacterized protein n=1 Tax=Bacillus inaquosorum KCTC 13429 TaxID=1236548 RepID=A0A9W5LF08_9BACI|nr:hypothetical protein [Bacillus inaquosorum]ELS59485.1 hypothetical protein BSI_38660 [Bacillus inaquosorum KCTC 13429]MCY8264658.1 hypothetical protein [Bacillus inaquosorum]
MGIIIYLVLQIGKTELYLPEFYIYCQKPVSFHWNYIGMKLDLKKEIQVLSTKFGISIFIKKK